MCFGVLCLRVVECYICVFWSVGPACSGVLYLCVFRVLGCVLWNVRYVC